MDKKTKKEIKEIIKLLKELYVISDIEFNRGFNEGLRQSIILLEDKL